MENNTKNSPSKQKIFFLLVLLLYSFLLNTCNNDFYFKYHADERTKARFIVENTQNFQHPILMLQMVRVFDSLLDLKDRQDITVVGRNLSAVYGTLAVLFAFLLFRLFLKEQYAFLIAFMFASVPIHVIHAHYFKEDVLVTCFMLLAFFCLFHYIQKPHGRNVVLFGLATGLALSSKYIAFLLGPYFLLLPLLILKNKPKKYYLKLILVFLIASVVFLIINYPIFHDLEVFRKGIRADFNNVIKGGHDVKLYPGQFFWTFHLQHSIIPGIGIPLTIFALLGIISSLIMWKKQCWQDRALLFITISFYFIVESTPFKTYPGYMRYVLPIIPFLLYFSFKGILLSTCWLKSNQKLIQIGILVLVLFYPLYDTYNLLYYLNRDTRIDAKKIHESKLYKIRSECYTDARPSIRSLSEVDIQKEKEKGTQLLIASSFMYGRFEFLEENWGQKKKVYRARDKYEEIFQYPYWEIKPAYKTFAYSNPVIRIIDIQDLNNE